MDKALNRVRALYNTISLANCFVYSESIKQDISNISHLYCSAKLTLSVYCSIRDSGSEESDSEEEDDEGDEDEEESVQTPMTSPLHTKPTQSSGKKTGMMSSDTDQSPERRPAAPSPVKPKAKV